MHGVERNEKKNRHHQQVGPKQEKVASATQDEDRTGNHKDAPYVYPISNNPSDRHKQNRWHKSHCRRHAIKTRRAANIQQIKRQSKAQRALGNKRQCLHRQQYSKMQVLFDLPEVHPARLVSSIHTVGM